MLILDSCVLIAYFRLEEKHFAEAKAILEQADEIILNDYVLGEIYTVLMLREGIELAQKALTWLVSNPKIRIERLTNDEIKKVVNYLQSERTKLSFADVSLLIMHQNRNEDFFSFDQKLMQKIEI